jgi:hypothetical protein
MRLVTPLLIAATSGLATQATAQAPQRPIDLRVMVQTWEPATDAETVTTALDRPGMVTELLLQGWDDTSARIRDHLVETMGAGDLLAPGVTLYDITLNLPRPTVAMTRSSGAVGPWTIPTVFEMRGVYLQSSITQPTIPGEWADPTCELRADLRLSVDLVIGNGPGGFVQVQAADPARAVQISNFSWDSQGIVCGGIETVASVAGLRDLLKAAVEGPVSVAVVSQMQGVADGLNAAIGGLGPQGSSLVGLWLTGTANQSSQRLTFAFGPRGPFPDFGPRGTLSGVIHMMPGVGFSCAEFTPTASRRSGPSPIVGPSGGLGDAPTEGLATEVTCRRGPGGDVTWSLTGLSTGYANYVDLPSIGTGCGRGQVESVTSHFDARAWPVSGDAILPAELGDGFDLTATRRSFRCPILEELPAELTLVDPLRDPDFAIQGFATPGQETFLNPQPLPPVANVLLMQQEMLRLQNQVISLQGQLLNR